MAGTAQQHANHSLPDISVQRRKIARRQATGRAEHTKTLDRASEGSGNGLPLRREEGGRSAVPERV